MPACSLQVTLELCLPPVPTGDLPGQSRSQVQVYKEVNQETRPTAGSTASGSSVLSLQKPEHIQNVTDRWCNLELDVNLFCPVHRVL